uniref:Uncharacterized protein n=1 Tax=Candidatus Kentrum sp. FM TaxID=2126340 RepID=A0A450TKH5_9GAMM|nr:MAG: hypothetical protein BECKFM1743C_GA0114222_100933 [Candidatus Kentron sp. FM]VFJ68122.1 MAG: hypothetical protein BECKFM1743A_GA0114220_104655 [Candidatus Kentron sp. FM]VFK21408.1 MAG: hypothetical protein BECKFM1743B_GA0114221_107841 [Candidatus Kentron sp. FM]
MQKSSCTPNIVKNSLKMLIYFHVNSAFSLVFASLWDTIRLLHLPRSIRSLSDSEAVKAINRSMDLFILGANSR